MKTVMQALADKAVERGTVVAECPVDESQDVPNAGHMTTYLWRNRYVDVIEWNDRAEAHVPGSRELADVRRLADLEETACR